jgi:hypothetical protein
MRSDSVWLLYHHKISVQSSLHPGTVFNQAIIHKAFQSGDGKQPYQPHSWQVPDACVRTDLSHSGTGYEMHSPKAD